MEIYREVCTALERLYERSAEGGSESSPQRARAQTTDALLTMSPADANYQVTCLRVCKVVCESQFVIIYSLKLSL